MRWTARAPHKTVTFGRPSVQQSFARTLPSGVCDAEGRPPCSALIRRRSIRDPKRSYERCNTMAEQTKTVPQGPVKPVAELWRYPRRTKPSCAAWAAPSSRCGLAEAPQHKCKRRGSDDKWAPQEGVAAMWIRIGKDQRHPHCATAVAGGGGLQSGMVTRKFPLMLEPP